MDKDKFSTNILEIDVFLQAYCNHVWMQLMRIKINVL